MYYKYVLKRIAAGFVMYAILMFTYAAIFNTVMDKTLKAQIDETVRAEIVKVMESKPNIDATAFTAERKSFYYELNHLDEPYLSRVFWKGFNTLRFKFGRSSVMTSKKGERDVIKIVGEAIPQTVILFTTSQVITLIIALWIGIKKAQNPGKKFDRSTSLFTMILFGMPSWWIAMMFIMFFGYKLKIFPTGGVVSVPPPEGTLNYIIDFLHHLALPVITLVIMGFWGMSFVIRNIVLGTLQEDFITSARARGINENKVLYSHTLRTAAPPIMTMVLLSILGSFGGSLIFESIFSWPGMGNLYLIANQQNDIPVLMGNLAFTTGLYITGIVILDLIYGFLDPRIKVGA